MQDKWFVVINPLAGGGAALRKLPKIQRALDQNNVQHIPCVTPDIAHARQQIHEALGLGFTRFMSVGGDGSHHTMINALAPDRRERRITVAIVPVGTGNDWARTHRIGRRVGPAVKAIVSGHVRAHAVGIVTLLDSPGHITRFVNVLGCGLDGQVVSTLAQSKVQPRGSLSYLIHGVRALVSYRPPELRVSAGEREESGQFITAHAGICRYSGGGMQFTPHARPGAQELAITCIRKTSKIGLIANLYRLYLGTIDRYKHVVTFTAPNVIFTADHGDLPVEADGEYLGNGSFSVRMVNNAFDLVIPER